MADAVSTKQALAKGLKATLEHKSLDRVTVGEDLQMVFAAAIDAKGVCVVPDYYPYHYWYNTASMTGQYDARYLEKIKLLRERMEAISDAKKGYDFRPQIRNDFLSLAIMAVKMRSGEIIGILSSRYFRKQKKCAGTRQCRKR